MRHLMQVAAGLESQIFGDDQIVTQVKDAAALAREAGSADAVLDTLFRRAVTAGKRVRTETTADRRACVRGRGRRAPARRRSSARSRAGAQSSSATARWGGWPPPPCGRRAAR